MHQATASCTLQQNPYGAFPRCIYKSGEINGIANLAFIGGRTNRRISNKPPAEYLSDLLAKHGPDHFRLQCIPTDTRRYTLERYPEFLRARRQLIAARLNEFLGHAKPTRVSADNTPEAQAY